MTADRRRPILERYPSAEDYIATARKPVEEGPMVEEDGERAAAAAADWSRPRYDVRLQ